MTSTQVRRKRFCDNHHGASTRTTEIYGTPRSPITRDCADCALKFVITNRRVHRLRCASCSHKHGGKKRAGKTFKDGRITKSCVICEQDFKRYKVYFDRIKSGVYTCSTYCKGEAIRSGLIVQDHSSRPLQHYAKGPDHPRWTGAVWRGISYGSTWRPARAAARKRDNDTCQHCSKTLAEVGRLDVHHIVRFMDFDKSEDANVLSNLITLCRQCHSKADHKQRIENGDRDPVNKFGPALKPRIRPNIKTFSKVAELLARNWFLRTCSPVTEGEDMRSLGHAVCRAVLGKNSRGLNRVNDLCQAGTLLRANAEIEADCWRFTLANTNIADPRSWIELFASGDHKQIVNAERTHYLDWLSYDAAAPTNWSGYAGWRTLGQRSERTRLAPATKRVWP